MERRSEDLKGEQVDAGTAVVLLLLLALVGGQRNQPDGQCRLIDPPADQDPVYIDANASELTGSVRFYTAFAGENGTDALIQEFNSYYPNVTVEYEVYKNNSDGNPGTRPRSRPWGSPPGRRRSTFPY